MPIYVPNTELSNEISVGAVLLRPGGSNDNGVLVNPFNPYVASPNYIPSTYVPASLGVVTGSMYLQSLMKTTESFSLDGPYVTFSLKM